MAAHSSICLKGVESLIREMEYINEYSKEVKRIKKQSGTSELSFRRPFENLIRRLIPEVDLVHEPIRKQGLGAPDFIVLHDMVPVGYIETKSLGTNLEGILESSQIINYRESIDNMILTDYRRFILLRQGEISHDLCLFDTHQLQGKSFQIREEVVENLLELLSFFTNYQKSTISSPVELATELSKRAKLLKALASQRLTRDLKIVSRRNDESPISTVHDFYLLLRNLIRDLDIDDCTDAYAQTITYGLFLAKINCRNDRLERSEAAYYIPANIGIIKRIFVNISGDFLPKELSWIVEEIIEILNASDIKTVLERIDFRGKKDRDPFTFFYEDFLAIYDPDKKKSRGIYYTPRPVVNFIVNSLQEILKTCFNKPLGFAEDDVTVLDIAAGTGTFLWLAYLLTLLELKNKGLGGLIQTKIEDHILEHFYGFELLITPYVISHLKLTTVLKKWGYDSAQGKRIPVYLTNTLENLQDLTDESVVQTLMKEISEESRAANEIKRKPILVIMGNPPYSSISENKGQWIKDLLKKGYSRADGSLDDGYYTVNGKKLGERKLQLQDDYVKFIRYAQWKIDMTGEGIIGFITNHSFLDGPTYRGMRESLLRSFDQIYILNLHGSVLRKEKSPDGSADENVFDIRPGVAISIFVKKPTLKQNVILYADLYGKRTYKYKWLDRKKVVSKVNWKKLEPESPTYLFIPVDKSIKRSYDRHWKLTDIFPKSGVGLYTFRDKLAIKWDEKEIWRTVTDFAHMKPEDARKLFDLGKDAQSWKVKSAQDDLLESGPKRDMVTSIYYRPFDIRYTYYTGKSGGFHARPTEMMQHMIHSNFALVVCRQTISDSWQHILVSKGITDNCYISNKTKERGYIFPLYLYPEKVPLGQTRHDARKPNINHNLIEHLEETYGVAPTPERIFFFVYAVLFSEEYRKKYNDVLKRDYPRIPFPKERNTFEKLAKFGEKLSTLHISEDAKMSKVRFNREGTNIVEKITFQNENVYINKEQWFEGIHERLWIFKIGAYEVLNKWLKDRKGRKLSGTDVEQYIRLVNVIEETIKLQNQIDASDFFNRI